MIKTVHVVIRASRAPTARSYHNLRLEVHATSVTDALGKAVAQAMIDGYHGRLLILRIELSPLVWLDPEHIARAADGEGPHAQAW